MTRNHLLNQGERLEDLHRNGYMLIQNPNFFCFGVDAVLLSSFAKIQKRDRVLDLCTGSGVIPILLAAKTQGEHFTGLEVITECADMAQRSVLQNELSSRISIVCGDLKKATSFFPCASFDVVTCNPPYIKKGGGIVNDATPKAIARHEILCTLEDVVFAASKMLKTGGAVFYGSQTRQAGRYFRLPS